MAHKTLTEKVTGLLWDTLPHCRRLKEETNALDSFFSSAQGVSALTRMYLHTKSLFLEETVATLDDGKFRILESLFAERDRALYHEYLMKCLSCSKEELAKLLKDLKFLEMYASSHAATLAEEKGIPIHVHRRKGGFSPQDIINSLSQPECLIEYTEEGSAVENQPVVKIEFKISTKYRFATAQLSPIVFRVSPQSMIVSNSGKSRLYTTPRTDKPRFEAYFLLSSYGGAGVYLLPFLNFNPSEDLEEYFKTWVGDDTSPQDLRSEVIQLLVKGALKNEDYVKELIEKSYGLVEK